MTEYTTKELLNKVNNLNEEINTAKSRRDQLMGERKGVLARLYDEFEVKNLKEVKQKIAAIDQRINRLNKQANAKWEEISEEFDVA
jgi:uncharacterized protein YoxC